MVSRETRLIIINHSETHSTRTVGLVGYPNVGKSSTINALIDAKKVSVSSTPGKTKHFQTIHLTPELILCDCPGLVFPNFATTKAELVCNGILPIDQLKDHMAPGSLLAERIPQSLLELKYGIKIPIRPVAEGGSGIPTAEELLTAYACKLEIVCWYHLTLAAARGYTKSGQGNPDESRAARVLLKDYINVSTLLDRSRADRNRRADFYSAIHHQTLFRMLNLIGKLMRSDCGNSGSANLLLNPNLKTSLLKVGRLQRVPLQRRWTPNSSIRSPQRDQ